MSGLLLKDFYILMKDCRWNVAMVLIFAVAGAFSDNLFWLVWPVMICGLLPGTIMGLEEQSGWLAYADTMPWSRKTVVAEKYVLMLILILGITLLMAAVYTFTGGLAKMELSITDMLAIALLIGTLPSCIMLPVNFKVGSAKGRIWYLIALGIAAGVGGGAGALLIDSGVGLPQNVGNFYWLLFVLPAAALAVSWMLSVKFYEKREL